MLKVRMASGILNDLDIHPRIIAAAKKAGFTTSWRLLETSLGELRTKTGLSLLDSERLMTAAARQCAPHFRTCWDLLQDERQNKITLHITTDCPNLDNILGGGLPYRGITEIAGESGTGKTQLALQQAIQCQLPPDSGGLGKGVAYICTETQFPIIRLNQLISFKGNHLSFNGKSLADNIHVHHLPDMDDLVDCVRYQLPQFVAQNGIGLVIIDSVAGAFRAAQVRQDIKSKMVQQLGFQLHQLAQKQMVAVLAINQVTSSFGKAQHGMMEDDIIPALGLSWANLVTTRIMLRKTNFAISPKISEDLSSVNEEDEFEEGGNEEANERRKQLSGTEMRIRVLDVVFSPWLGKKSSPFTITEKGICDADPLSMKLALD